jgi:ketosteroid isomerase-like protein
MSQENVETLTRVYAGWERGDFGVSVALFDRNITLVIDPGIPGGGVFVGRDGVRAYMKDFLEAWDSVNIAAQSFEAVGDSVFVKVRQSGIGRGSGVNINQEYFQLWTFRGGKVIRVETILSQSEALEAVGLSE